MKKFISLFLILCVLIISSFGQKTKQFYFKINGTINADTGTMRLDFFSDYFPNKVKELITKVENNKFSFSGYIPSPESVFILYNDSYVSSNFIIDKGLQTVLVNVDSSRKVPKVLNSIMINEQKTYAEAFSGCENNKKKLDKEYDSSRIVYSYKLPDSVKITFENKYNEIYTENDKILLNYAIKHPDSQMAFWKLISLMSWGYEPIFSSIYTAFSADLKNSYAGKMLAKRLTMGKLLSLNQKFPYLQCIDFNNQKLPMDIFSKAKFSLIDFWYSTCGPCRAQFNSLKRLYTKYNNKGFEIIGISTDKVEKRDEWEKAVTNERLVWKQYWDKNGKESGNLSINVFPTNFLIDNTGKIIAKNISLEKLELFLAKNLN